MTYLPLWHLLVSSGENYHLHSFNMQMQQILFFATGLPHTLNPLNIHDIYDYCALHSDDIC